MMAISDNFVAIPIANSLPQSAFIASEIVKLSFTIVCRANMRVGRGGDGIELQFLF